MCELNLKRSGLCMDLRIFSHVFITHDLFMITVSKILSKIFQKHNLSVSDALETVVVNRAVSILFARGFSTH